MRSKRILAFLLAVFLLCGNVQPILASPVDSEKELTAEGVPEKTEVSPQLPEKTEAAPQVPEETEATADGTAPEATIPVEPEETTPEAPPSLPEDSQAWNDAAAEAFCRAAVDGTEPAMLPRSYIEEVYREMMGIQADPEDDEVEVDALYSSLRPVSNKNLIVPKTYYGMYWKNPNNGNRWQQWGGKWNIEKFDFFELSTGQTGYCIEPFNPNPAIGVERVPISWRDIHVKWASAGGKFEYEKQEGIALALAYGAPNNGDESDNGKWATAALVWDMACGYRKSDGTLRFSPSPFETVLRNNHPAVYSKFTEIVDSLKNYRVIPSFAAPYPSWINEQSTHTLTLGSDGNYSVTLHDSNGVLEHFNYVSPVKDVTFTKNGNDLTITATPEAAKQLESGRTINNRGQEVAVDPEKVCTVWQATGGSKSAQLFACLDAALDPTPSYFRLKAENPKGRLVIPKWTNTGSSLGGWHFNIYRDSACTDLVDTCTTGSDGYAWSGYLDPGTYYVREVDESDQYPYWQFDDSVRRYEVYAGQNTWGSGEQCFYNHLKGRIHVRKTTNVGAWVSGWKFDVYDAAGRFVETITTDDSGNGYSSMLEPGEYKVIEQQEAIHWDCDTSDHFITVTGGSDTTEEWHNVLMGQLEVQKTAVNGSPEGWNFEVYKDGQLVEKLTTGPDGKARSKYLHPGTYTVREIHDRDDTYWDYDVNVEQDTVVSPGVNNPSIVPYTNTQYGRLAVKKQMDTDGPLGGWQFRITDERTGTEIPGSPFTTDDQGNIITDKLKPGQYTVDELIPENSPYYCKSENPQTITVVEGDTAAVTFTNALRPGKIDIQKVDREKNPLPGAKFLLEWSSDGTTWLPVTYSDSPDVVMGGCSNPDLVDGCLVSDVDGLVVFDGLYPTIQYRLTEVEAPEGYQLLSDRVFVGELSPEQDFHISFTVVNGRGFELPATGETSLLIFLATGMTLCVVAAFGLTMLKKRKTN